MDKQLKLQHFLWRTGFGPDARTWNAWYFLNEREWWEKCQRDSAAQPEVFDVADNAVKGALQGLGDLAKMEREDLDKADKKRVREQSREDLKSLNLRWLDEMSHSKAQLREKMALFWHGHFASRNINILYQQQLLDVVRTHALGNFRDLLRAVSKSAAMLAFLNNQQNKKKHPNENFAREVMELFTLGRGHYTETDVKEAARAFTGWGFRLNGEFAFRAHFHDNDPKTVLGKTGNWDGDQVLDLLLEQRPTAHFVVRKLYRFLVNENRVPEERIAWLANRFFDHNYELLPLLGDIFTSSWFYDTENVGCNIKSPVALWVGLRRSLALTVTEPEGQLLLQRALGQILFYPPNVAGWPGGSNWIDSSSLMLRLRIPHILAEQAQLDVNTKDDDDAMMGQKGGSKIGRRLNAAIDWQPLLEQVLGTMPEREVLGRVARFLWQTPAAQPPVSVLEAHTRHGSKKELIQSTVIQLMATPEYQLC